MINENLVLEYKYLFCYQIPELGNKLLHKINNIDFSTVKKRIFIKQHLF